MNIRGRSDGENLMLKIGDRPSLLIKNQNYPKIAKEAGGPKVTGYFKETPKRPVRDSGEWDSNQQPPRA